MSADNGIYIAQFPSCWRVAYASAIENIEYHPQGSEERLDELKNYFGKSPRFLTESKALEAAREMSKGYEILEYGICILAGIWEDWEEDLPVEEPRYDWFSLRNQKPTETQLWMGDKKIANIQGTKHIHDIEEFVRMANLGVAVHREEIKRRLEDMLETTPDADTCMRGESRVFTHIDELSCSAAKD